MNTVNTIKKIVLALIFAAALYLVVQLEFAPYSNVMSNPLNKARAAGADNSMEETFIPPVEHLVTYISAGQEYYSERVEDGKLPREAVNVNNPGFLGWLDEEGETVEPSQIPVTSDITYTALLGPALVENQWGYFPCESDGLFYPDRELVRSELAEIIYGLLREKPKGDTVLNDVKKEADYYKAAAAVITAGYMERSGESFRPNIAVTKEELNLALGQIFNAFRLKELLEPLGETITRGDAAVLLNSLLGLESKGSGAALSYYPDVPDTMSCHDAVALAGTLSEKWAPAGQKCPSGFFLTEGYLYCIDEKGYLVKNAKVGTLEFGEDYRFSSGSQELDDYVAKRLEIIQKANPSADMDGLLEQAYAYIRDSNLYLKGNHYEVGENGWEIEEALKIFKNNKGNCYSFAAAFWALARGLGFEARCISGLISHTYQSHGWVEIEYDGEPYVFDVEQEGIYYRVGEKNYNVSMYKMDYATASTWSYIRTPEDVPEEAKK